jgi:O-antigen ligase
MTSFSPVRPVPWSPPLRPVAGPDAPALQPSATALGFFFFVLLNAVLYIRPSEYIGGVYGDRIYLSVILACLAVSFPAILSRLSPASLARQPQTACVLLLLVVIPLSQIVHGQMGIAWDGGIAFAKTVAYYLLLIALVTTPSRLRQLLCWLPLFTTVLAGLAVLNFHQIISLDRIKAISELIQAKIITQTQGVKLEDQRLVVTGIFGDPNDFSLLLVASIVLSLYWLGARGAGGLRFLWLLPIGLFLYALMRTQSRGGMLALLVALFLLFRARFGWMMAFLLGACVTPALLLLGGSRQAELGTGAATAQERLQLWSDALMSFRNSPLLGIGYDQMVQDGSLVAHNSYLHAFAEMGIVGGMLFLGMFSLSFKQLWDLNPDRRTVLDPQLRRLQPFMLSLLGGFMTSIFSLTQCYVLPTYTVLGLTTMYLEQASAWPPRPVTRFDATLLKRMLVWSAVFLVLMYIFVRTTKPG